MPDIIFRLSGFAGPGLIILGIVYSALCYRGRQGERYSLLNHFISELGEVGVSREAWAFNLGLILGGLVLLPYIVRLGIIFSSLPGWIGMGCGILAVLAVAAVGIFPMNNLDSHMPAALTYFRSGLVMVFFFGLAILLQPASKTIIPPAANLFSLLAFGAYATFLLRISRKKPAQKPEDPPVLQPESERPRLSVPAVLEWAVFFTTILWLFGVAFFI